MITPDQIAAIDALQVSQAYAWLIPAVMAAASYFAGKKGNKSKQTSTSTNASTASSTPTLAPEYQGIQQSLIPMIQSKLANPYKLPAGFEQAGIRNINKTYDLAGQGLANNMTARGLGRSAIAGAGEGALAGGRASDIVQYQGTLPMIERGFQSEDIGQAMSLMNMGRGNTTTSSGTASGVTENQSGGGNMAGILSMLQMLGYMQGAGQLGGGRGTYQPKPNSTGFEYF